MNEEPRNLPLILASGSAARRALLERLGLPFQVIPADVNEDPMPDETPEALVARLACAKAAHIAAAYPQAVVIGSDQVAVFDGVATSKPGTAARARQFLQRFGGQHIQFLTAVSVQCQDTGVEHSFMDRTEVIFRALSGDEIDRYVTRDNPLACAGAFKVESLGPTLFDEVRSSDPTGLPGLPLIGLSRCLRQMGYTLP